MKRDLIYRAYCAQCREVVRWQEPSGNQVDKILCPRCGRLLPCTVGSQYFLKGEMSAEARTMIKKKKGK